MSKNSRKIMKILTLLFCEASSIGGMKSNADENRNLQLIAQNSKNTSKSNKENTNWIKQNPIKSLLIGLFGVAGLVLCEEIIRRNCFVNNKKDTEDKVLEVFNSYNDKWEALCKLLGKNGAEFVRKNYSEWEKRINNGQDRFALMSIYHSLNQ